MKNVNKIIFVLFLSCVGLVSSLSASPVTNKQIVTNAFIQWEQGKGSPFSLLREDATWTILGPTPSAKTYSLSALKKEVLIPFQKRLASPLKPMLKNVYEDSDKVIILFEAAATLINGEAYNNSYAWFFTMKDGKVTQVVAVLDLNAYEKVMAIKVSK